MIPFFELKSQYRAIKDEIDHAIAEVLQSGWFVLGDRLIKFEEEFASYVGTRHAVGVGSGTEAVHLSLLAAGVGQGDLVATVPLTAVATISAIRAAGAEPIFVDIDPTSYTMCIASLEAVLRKRDGEIKAVLPVHLYGQTADMDSIIRTAGDYDVPVIEDSCQAHGAEYKGKKAGSIGLLGAFSFYPSKNLGAYGDGGMITTNDVALAEKLKLLRNYGQKERYDSVTEGINSRLDEMQAAVLSVKLKYLDEWNERRGHLAALYTSLISPEKASRPDVASYAKHAYHLYAIRHGERENLKKYLEENGVATQIHYPVPIHLQGGYSWMGLKEGSLPMAEMAARETLSLPLYPELSEGVVEMVAGLVNDFKA